jgi:spore protease
LQSDGQSNDYLNKLKNTDKYQIIREALLPKDFNLIVTPKEIDDLIENMKDVVSRGINFAM